MDKRPDEPEIDWVSDPSADNDEYLEPWLDEGFESEPDDETEDE